MKKLFVLLLTACLLFTGCQLATEETSKDGVTSPDRLVGVVVTTEHLDLFDVEAYLEDNLNDIMAGKDADQSAYQGRIYAQEEVEKSTTEDGVPCTTTYYNFDHIGGIQLLYYETQTLLEDGTVLSDFTNGYCTEGFGALSYGGDLNEGTIYVPDDTAEVCIFVNPVYQDAEGRLYLVAGTGLSTNHIAGSMSQNISEEYTETVNGEETTVKREFKITVEGVHVPEKVVIYQMSGENEILDRQEYVPGQLPEELTPVDGCAYILVEEYAGEEITRELMELGDKTVAVSVRSEKLYCTADVCEILWPEE